MLSHEEQRLLDGMERFLAGEDPRFTRGFEFATARQRHRRRAEARILTLVILGAIVVSVGVALLSVDARLGSLVAGMGCAVLAAAVATARRSPTNPAASPEGVRSSWW